jgi:hypothetical protein
VTPARTHIAALVLAACHAPTATTARARDPQTLDWYVSPDGAYARVTIGANGTIDLADLATLSRACNQLTTPWLHGGDEHRLQRIDVCAAEAQVQLAVTPNTVAIAERTVEIASRQLCFADCDFAKPYVLASVDWLDHDLHIFVQTAVDTTSTAPPVRVWSVPARPETELLALIHFPP